MIIIINIKTEHEKPVDLSLTLQKLIQNTFVLVSIMHEKEHFKNLHPILY
jgi:hypothetical protein